MEDKRIRTKAKGTPSKRIHNNNSTGVKAAEADQSSKKSKNSYLGTQAQPISLDDSSDSDSDDFAEEKKAHDKRGDVVENKPQDRSTQRSSRKSGRDSICTSTTSSRCEKNDRHAHNNTRNLHLAPKTDQNRLDKNTKIKAAHKPTHVKKSTKEKIRSKERLRDIVKSTKLSGSKRKKKKNDEPRGIDGNNLDYLKRLTRKVFQKAERKRDTTVDDVFSILKEKCEMVTYDEGKIKELILAELTELMKAYQREKYRMKEIKREQSHQIVQEESSSNNNKKEQPNNHLEIRKTVVPEKQASEVICLDDSDHDNDAKKNVFPIPFGTSGHNFRYRSEHKVYIDESCHFYYYPCNNEYYAYKQDKWFYYDRGSSPPKYVELPNGPDGQITTKEMNKNPPAETDFHRSEASSTTSTAIRPSTLSEKPGSNNQSVAKSKDKNFINTKEPTSSVEKSQCEPVSVLKKRSVIKSILSETTSTQKKRSSAQKRTAETPQKKKDNSKDVNLCSSCAISLLPPFYSVHTHPTLDIPVCAVCENDAYATESDVIKILDDRQAENEESNTIEILDDDKKSSSDMSNVDICCFCSDRSNANTESGDGIEEEEEEIESDPELLCCDSCPRAFCTRCIKRCLGGDAKSLKKMIESDDDWNCLVCSSKSDSENNSSIYTGLKNLQTDLKRIKEEMSIEKTDEELIKELCDVENAIHEAEEILEEKNLEEQRELIRKELIADKHRVSSSDLDEEVEEELELYRVKWDDHHTRLSESLTRIQDTIGADDCDIDLEAFYKAHNQEKQKETEEAAKQRKSAEKEIDERYIKMGAAPLSFLGASGFKSRNCKYDLHNTPAEILEVEEINSNEDVVNSIRNARSKSSKYLTSFEGVEIRNRFDDEDFIDDFQYEFEAALELEDKELREKSKYLDRIKKRREDVDKKSNKRQNIHGFETSQLREAVKGRKRQQKAIKQFQSTNAASKRKKKRASLTTVSNEPISTEKPLGNIIGYNLAERSYESSKFVLNETEIKENPNTKKITVTKHLADVLKSHQKDGVQFLFDNICGSLSKMKLKVENKGIEPVSGCMLAHSMGLGKSLQVISFLHTVLKNPKINSIHKSNEKDSKPLFHTAVICVPVNTFTNWLEEFTKWLGRGFNIYSIDSSTVAKKDRPAIVYKWSKSGGILLLSFDIYTNITGERKRKVDNTPLTPETLSRKQAAEKEELERLCKALQDPGPDVFVIDEAHQVLKKSTNARFRSFAAVETKHRIALSGTPVQNNLQEYFHLVNWIKPGILGSEKDFRKNYIEPMDNGVATDSTLSQKELANNQSKELFEKLQPFIHRLTAQVLRNDLPEMQQAVLHVRMMKHQLRLMHRFKKISDREKYGLIEQCSKLRPVFNHPRCLLAKKKSKQDAQQDGSEWWQKVYKKYPDMGDFSNSGKLVLLLQILVLSEMFGDKLLVFSQSIVTLDVIEEVLKSPQWEESIPTLKKISPGKTWGSWRNDIDYLRIDGSTNASSRGQKIKSFSKENNDVKIFLISTMAGGIGINLVQANRVILFDSHFNPTVDLQALSRCYRYGQTKPVFVYRFLAEGTMEEKIYNRQVEKQNLSSRVIDDQRPEAYFSAVELNYLNEAPFDSWVQCDECEKWRMLPPDSPEQVDDLPDKWYCWMNKYDKDRSNCCAKERDQAWYQKYFLKRMERNKMENVFKASYMEVKCKSCGKIRWVTNTFDAQNFCCSDNLTYDDANSSCKDEEKSFDWYVKRLANKMRTSTQSSQQTVVSQGFTQDDADGNTQPDRFTMNDVEKKNLVEKDKVLSKIIPYEGSITTQQNSLISKFLFHDMLLEDKTVDAIG